MSAQGSITARRGEEGAAALARPRPRSGRELMRPERLAAMQPCRLSRARALVNKLVRERWRIRLQRLEVDASASGVAIYSVQAPQQEFSFIAFSHPPSRTARTGRIIGQAWDMMGTLNEGPATPADIAAAQRELPKLYRGRATPNALTWCRCNRSMRVFGEALARLASGHQPAIAELAKVCYLMRNTGIDGNGTFGTRSFASLGAAHALGAPLEAQLMTAYLMREFSCDLIEQLARSGSRSAVPLERGIRRFIGVGNGSALGLIFFVQNHPRLIDAWIGAREQAMALARALELSVGDARVARLLELIRAAILFRRQDRMHYEAFDSSAAVAADLERIVPAVLELQASGLIEGRRCHYPLDVLARRFESELRPEAAETFLSLLLELIPEEADALGLRVSGDDELTVSPSETVASLCELIRGEYAWALATDRGRTDSYRYVWYKSQSAEEPRRGPRQEVPQARDLALDICGELQQLLAELQHCPPSLSVARFLLEHPQHRQLIARIQCLRGREYHTPMANIHAVEFVPIHLVRLMNVAIHGIDKTRDFLNRNLRGVLFHGAPIAADLPGGYQGSTFYPSEPL